MNRGISYKGTFKKGDEIIFPKETCVLLWVRRGKGPRKKKTEVGKNLGTAGAKEAAGDASPRGVIIERAAR